MSGYVFSTYYGHDASIAIVGEGRILHYEYERWNREKHTTWPADANEHIDRTIDEGCAQLGITRDEIIAYVGMGCASDFGGQRGSRPYWGENLHEYDSAGVTEFVGIKKPLWYVAHHLAHAGYAAYTAPFRTGRVIAIDGGGDAFFSEVTRHAEVIDTGAGDFDVDDPETPITLKCIGQTQIGGAWDKIGHDLYGRWHQAGTLMALTGVPDHLWTEANGCPDPGLKPVLCDLQRKTSAALNALVPWGTENVALAGGVALNGIAVYELLRRGDIKAVHVPPAVHDGGLTVGAALFVLHAVLKQPWTGYSPETIAFSGYADPRISEEPDIEQIVSDLCDDYVVGLCVGGAESGPRALGHRSILASPTREEMKARINRVKGRQGFRPVAPVVLRKYAAEYFDLVNPDCYSYMTTIARATGRAIAEAPAVVHWDGSARVQVVDESSRLGRIIEGFRQRTDVPILCNTSLNLAGEAIANDYNQACDTFYRSEMDTLYVGSERVVR